MAPRCLTAALEVLLLARAVHARNWYWARLPTGGDNRCAELPEAGVTTAMGHTMLADSDPIIDQVGWSNGLLHLEARDVPVGDYFAITLEGLLRGGSSLCGGRYVYGSVPRDGVVRLEWAPPATVFENGTTTRVVLVRGNGQSQTYVRLAVVSAFLPCEPPATPQPARPGRQRPSPLTPRMNVAVVIGIVGVIVFTLMMAILIAWVYRIRWRNRNANAAGGDRADSYTNPASSSSSTSPPPSSSSTSPPSHVSVKPRKNDRVSDA